MKRKSRFQAPSQQEIARAHRLMEALERYYPTAHCELNYTSPHELLVATILSAQTTDVGVNKVTPALFARFPTPAAFAASSPAEIEPFIQTIGLFRAKARSVHEAMTHVVDRFGGKVPSTMAELLTLRGVARKTANVVLGNAFNINDGFVVDTHIDRLAKRFGLAPVDAGVPQVEQRLMALFPRDHWCKLSHQIIWHGRRSCKARHCDCSSHEICRTFGPCGSESAKGTFCEGCPSAGGVEEASKTVTLGKAPRPATPPTAVKPAKSGKVRKPRGTSSRNRVD